MITLFLDTSYNQTLGLLDEKGNWVRRSTKEGQKSSSILHSELHQLCLEAGIQAAEIKNVLYLAGPGFYTGLRIAFGLAEMLKTEGCTTQGFYSFSIPLLLDVQDYTWITKAYRGEVFVHSCHAGQGTSRLISEKDFLASAWTGPIYIHNASALDQLMAEKLPGAIETEDLMLQNMSKLWTNFLSAQSLELFYFRPPEEEFKPSV